MRPANVRQIIAEARVEGTSNAEYNGRIAASASFDTPSGRYVVEGVAERPVAIKPENLILPPHTRVTITGVSSRPELNGKAATIMSSDGRERYTVQVGESGEQMRLKLGAVVGLHGLSRM